MSLFFLLLIGYVLLPGGIDCPIFRRPVVTYTLLAFLVLSAGAQFLGKFLFPGFSSSQWIHLLGFQGDWDAPWQIWTYSLCHRNVFDAIACLMILYCVGPALEDRVGRLRMSAFYLAGCVSGPLLLTAAREMGSIPSNALLYGFSIPLNFLLGVVLVLMPWVCFKVWYAFWCYRVGSETGTLDLPSFIVIAGYLYFVQNKRAFFVEGGERIDQTPGPVLQIASLLLGFIAGGCLFGFRNVLKGSAVGQQEEGRVQRSLRRALRKNAAEETDLEGADTSFSPAPVVKPVPGGKPEAMPPSFQPVSPAVRPTQPPSSRFSDRFGETFSVPSSPAQPQPNGDVSAFGLCPLGEEFPSGLDSKGKPLSPIRPDEKS
jgi:membrane associated rhomboid family serine protease